MTHIRMPARRFGCVLALPLMVAVLSLGGCTKATGPQERPPEAGDIAVAHLNGETIWTSDVRSEAVAQGDIAAGEPLDMTSDLFSRTLDEVIDQRLLADAARAQGLEKSILAQRRLRAAHDHILGDMLIENTIQHKVDDKAVQAHYDKQAEQARHAEEIRTRLILLKNKAEADAVIKALKGGAVFETLALQESIDDETRTNGGDMGYVTADSMPQAYKKVLNTAKVGDLLGPVQVDEGWAVLRVEDRRPEQMPSLEDERPIIMRYLIYNQVADMLSDLRKKARIERLIAKPETAEEELPPDTGP
ncbi:MAG: peptidyl-prolyl cis-trans isomerase [Asticcacaulis sp.]